MIALPHPPQIGQSTPKTLELTPETEPVAIAAGQSPALAASRRLSPPLINMVGSVTFKLISSISRSL